MKYVVDEFMDTVKEKSDKQAAARKECFSLNPPPRYKHVFDTREAASAFIIKRSQKSCADAGLALRAALRRLRKCEKKFQ